MSCALFAPLGTDVLAIINLCGTLYRQCYRVTRGAPEEFRSLSTELCTLKTSLEILQEEVENPNSVLVTGGEKRLELIKDLLKQVKATLSELGKFTKKYKEWLDSEPEHPKPGPSDPKAKRFKPKQIWAIIKWSSEMSDIDRLRNKLSYNNGIIHLLLTSAGNSSLECLQADSTAIRRRLSDIHEFIYKSQKVTTNAQSTNHEDLLMLSAAKGLVKYEFSGILKKNAEVLGPWKATGINDWIKAGRWWLLKYKYQMQSNAEMSDDNNTVSKSAYTTLIKASWILSDIIMEHPQMNLLESTIQYHVRALAEEISREFKTIESKGFMTPKLEDLEYSELYIWEHLEREETPQHIPRFGDSGKSFGLSNSQFEVIFQTCVNLLLVLF